ncbi:unnamed protein product [Orchesella dallaii]|uniref:Uncharacterized protein n=1 Tax=Orchesella dallaii TaxID=48710 RepID=A0ABP1SAW7_9HEXA
MPLFRNNNNVTGSNSVEKDTIGKYSNRKYFQNVADKLSERYLDLDSFSVSVSVPKTTWHQNREKVEARTPTKIISMPQQILSFPLCSNVSDFLKVRSRAHNTTIISAESKKKKLLKCF